MWLVSLIDDSRPPVRQECKRHPSADYVILGEDDDGEWRYSCRHSGLAEVIVIVLSDLESVGMSSVEALVAIGRQFGDLVAKQL